jgi:hypothetical protein
MPKIDKSLTIEEIEYYYSLLNEEITNYDCGELCKYDNNGIPYCCSVKMQCHFCTNQNSNT